MFKRQEKGKRFKRWLLAIFCLAVILPGGWFLWNHLEGETPVLEITRPLQSVPAQFPVTGMARDAKSGIARVFIGLLQNGKETVLLDQAFPSRGVGRQGTVFEHSIDLAVDTQKIGLSDGPATLRVMVRDHSWRNWWKGNQSYLERELTIDTRPPVLSVLSTQHNAAPGGSGLVIYQLSEPCAKSGVYVGEDFFPGHAGFFDDPDIYLAFFAVPWDYDRESPLSAAAVDSAGNSARSGFYHHIRGRRFISETLTISDAFLNLTLPAFQGVEGYPADQSLADQFVFVNTVLRQRNNQSILANGQNTVNRILWDGAFGRLPNAARRANFGDQRAYQYNGAVLTHAVHLGIDLASAKQAEVPAANHGRVVFAEPAGIYGNVVCLDHGFGLMSLYAHLSRITVAVDDLVSKGDIVGYTGTTGLAGGDHLHFGMFIDHVFVDPVEWWDSAWIKNNITSKIESVRAMAR